MKRTVSDSIIIKAVALEHWALMALMAVAVLSCQRDEPDGTARELGLMPAFASSTETVIETRAAVTVSGTATASTYNDDAPANGTNIRVYAVPLIDETDDTDEKKQANRRAGSFRYSNNRWHSSVTVQGDETYYLYAITPAFLPGVSDQGFNWAITEAGYFNTDSARLSFKSLDVLTASDPMANIASAGRAAIIDGAGLELAQDGVTPLSPQPGAEPLTKNDFGIGTIPQDFPDAENNKLYKIWMAMDHLYSKATVSMSVDDKYDAIRTIRINSISLTTESHLTGSHSYSFTDGLELDEQAVFSDGTETSINLLSGPTAFDGVRESGEDYAILTPTPKPFAWFCFLPVSYVPDLKYPDDVKLRVGYDVLDKNGKVIRAGQTVENKFQLTLFKRDTGAEISPHPGDHFKVKVKIRPTYLYQLSDDDSKLELLIE